MFAIDEDASREKVRGLPSSRCFKHKEHKCSDFKHKTFSRNHRFSSGRLEHAVHFDETIYSNLITGFAD